jgi:hypothetical protein
MRTSAGRARIGLVTSIAATAACGSDGPSPSHVDADVDQRPDVGQGGDVGQRVDEMTIGAARPGAPCAVHPDCGDAYLTCAAGACAIRYQRLCGTDSDWVPWASLARRVARARRWPRSRPARATARVPGDGAGPRPARVARTRAARAASRPSRASTVRVARRPSEAAGAQSAAQGSLPSMGVGPGMSNGTSTHFSAAVAVHVAPTRPASVFESVPGVAHMCAT